MPNVLSKLKERSVSTRQPNSRADLEQAIERADDARGIAKDLLRRLPDYDGSESEDTARHDMGARVVIENHYHQSQPDIELESSIEVGPFKAKGLPRWATWAIVTGGLVVAAITAAASRLVGK